MSLGDAKVTDKMGARARPPKARTPEERAAAAAQNRVEQAELILANEERALAARQERVSAARKGLEEARGAKVVVMEAARATLAGQIEAQKDAVDAGTSDAKDDQLLDLEEKLGRLDAAIAEAKKELEAAKAAEPAG